MKGLKYLVSLSFLTLIVWGCRSNKTEVAMKQDKPAPTDFAAGPPAIVYKTRQDYSDKVAVILSEDRKTIVAYPHPQDIARRGSEVYPASLNEGYLLDRQGINQWVAFTRYTFAEYAALPQAPELSELEAGIIDKTPLLEFCNCGKLRQYTDVVKSMNDLIAGGLESCAIRTTERK